jgi:hypothetical protein
MKRKIAVITIIALLPLIAAGIFALFGIIFSFWVYLLLAIICPIEAGILWFIYKDMERKIAEAKKEAERR